MYQLVDFLDVHLKKHVWHIFLELLVKLLNFVGLKHNLSEAVESTDFYFSLGVVGKHHDLLNDIVGGIADVVDLILFVDVVDNVEGLVFEKSVRVSSHVLKQLFNPHPFICLHDELSDHLRNNLADRYLRVPELFNNHTN